MSKVISLAERNLQEEYSKSSGYVFTVQEIAAELKVSKNYVYELIKHGHLQALKLGSMKITRFEFLRFLETYSGKDLSDLQNVKGL